MIYVKVDADFIPAEEISRLCGITLEEVMDCVDKGLLLSRNLANKYFPEYFQSVCKIMFLFELSRYDLPAELKSELVSKYELLSSQTIESHMELSEIFGKYNLDFETCEMIISKVRNNSVDTTEYL